MTPQKGVNPFASGGIGRAMRAVKQEQKAATAAPAPAAPEKKSAISLRQIDGPDGEIVHMEQGERYSSGDAKSDRARVTIRHGTRKKSGKKGYPDSIDEQRTELHLKPHQLKGLKVGDKVSIHIRKH